MRISVVWKRERARLGMELVVFYQLMVRLSRGSFVAAL